MKNCLDSTRNNIKLLRFKRFQSTECRYRTRVAHTWDIEEVVPWPWNGRRIWDDSEGNNGQWQWLIFCNALDFPKREYFQRCRFNDGNYGWYYWRWYECCWITIPPGGLGINERRSSCNLYRFVLVHYLSHFVHQLYLQDKIDERELGIDSWLYAE